MSNTLGQAIDALAALIDARAGADPQQSYTAKLLAQGPMKCAKKLGEEGVEAALAAVAGDKDALAGEAADVLYHLLVTLKAGGVLPGEVAAVLQQRQEKSGLEEKASR
jgi:phosphoribosyl-ATP pyrophosphohydrolase